MDYLTVKLDPSAIGILLAVLALWAQLWVGYSKAKSVERQRVVTIGLVWIYCAIFFGFIAIIASVLESRGTVETIRINIEGICFVTFFSDGSY
jgi:cell division protein FtsX